MAVFRVERTHNYTVMSNYHLRDKNLSLKAKGLLSQMLSLPEDWDYTLAGLAHINSEGKDAIRECSASPEPVEPNGRDVKHTRACTVGKDEMDAYRQQLRANIGYDAFARERPWRATMLPRSAMISMAKRCIDESVTYLVHLLFLCARLCLLVCFAQILFQCCLAHSASRNHCGQEKER
jgi:hypothetical protein